MGSPRRGLRMVASAIASATCLGLDNCGIFNAMINDYISSYLEKARYEIIDNGKTFYAEIPALKGVWATGKTLEGRRKELASVLEGWIILHLRNNLPIPGFKLPRLKMREKAYA